MSWKLPWIDCSVKTNHFFVTDKSECTGWICENFPTFSDVYTDVGWLNTSVVCS